MKKLLTTGALLLAAFFSYAQSNSSTSDGTGFSAGLRAGGTFLLNKQDDFPVQGITLENKLAPSYTVGLIANYGFNSSFSIQPEVLYSQLSTQFKANIQGETLTLRADVNALEIPVLFKYSFGERVRLFVNAGPFIYYLLNGQTKLSFQGDSETDKITYDQNDGRLNYGATAGIGATIPLGPGSLLAEGRFNYTLGDNAKNTTHENLKVFNLSVGYLIPLSAFR